MMSFMWIWDTRRVNAGGLRDWLGETATVVSPKYIRYMRYISCSKTETDQLWCSDVGRWLSATRRRDCRAVNREMVANYYRRHLLQPVINLWPLQLARFRLVCYGLRKSRSPDYRHAWRHDSRRFLFFTTSCMQRWILPMEISLSSFKRCPKTLSSWLVHLHGHKQARHLPKRYRRNLGLY